MFLYKGFGNIIKDQITLNGIHLMLLDEHLLITLIDPCQNTKVLRMFYIRWARDEDDLVSFSHKAIKILKGIVQTKMKILSLITLTRVVPNQ